MAKNYVIDGGTGELDVGGNTLANRFDLPDAMPPKRQNLAERFGFKKGSHWSDYINPGEWAQGYPSEEVREDFKQDVGHAWDFAKHAGTELIKDFFFMLNSIVRNDSQENKATPFEFPTRFTVFAALVLSIKSPRDSFMGPIF